jgi:RecB family exonuclease
VLVRRAIDDDGRELAPSPYWMEALRLAGRRPDCADLRAGAGGEIAADPAAAATEREAVRALAAAGRSAPGELAEALARRRRPLGLPSRPFAGLRSFSVTDLEAYLRCAYGWLHDRVIAPQELTAAFDARAEGEFGHTVLRRLFERVEGPCTSERLERFTTALTEVLDEVAEEVAHPGAGRVFGAFVRRTGIHLAALLAREAASEPRFRPTGFEQRLREEGLVADAVVTGRADRIDLAPDGRYAVAIDYKRSRAAYDPDAEEAHQRLQLPLYAEAAARAVGAESAGGLYVAIAKEDVGGRLRDDVAAYGTPPAPLVPAAEWRDIVAEAVRDAERAVQGIRAGDLGEPGACDSPWCGHGVLWR